MQFCCIFLSLFLSHQAFLHFTLSPLRLLQVSPLGLDGDINRSGGLIMLRLSTSERCFIYVHLVRSLPITVYYLPWWGHLKAPFFVDYRALASPDYLTHFHYNIVAFLVVGAGIGPTYSWLWAKPVHQNCIPLNASIFLTRTPSLAIVLLLSHS